MNIKNSIFYKSIAESYRHFAKPGIAIDILFSITFAAIYSFFALKILTILDITSQKDISIQNFKDIIFLVVILAIVVYLHWHIFQRVSWWLAHRHAGFLGKTIAIDFAFFVTFSLIFSAFFFKISNLLNTIKQIIPQMGSNISADTIPSADTVSALVSQSNVFMQNFRSLMFLVILLAIAVYLLWCVFQGTSWWLTHRHVGKKMTLFNYLGKFSLFSLIWFIAFVAVAFAITELSGYLTIGSVELISTNALMYILGIVFMIILYFSFISYTLLHHNIIEIFKGIFHVGVRKAYITVPLFLFAILKTYILFRILMLLGLDLFYTVLLGIIIFIPVMIWSRILINLAAHRVHRMRD